MVGTLSVAGGSPSGLSLFEWIVGGLMTVLVGVGFAIYNRASRFEREINSHTSGDVLEHQGQPRHRSRRYPEIDDDDDSWHRRGSAQVLQLAYRKGRVIVRSVTA